MSFCSVLLARATDYWREMLKDNTKQEIKQYNSQYDSQCTDKATQYAAIKAASDEQTIPEFFFDTHWIKNLNKTPLNFLKQSSQMNNFTVFFQFFIGM